MANTANIKQYTGRDKTILRAGRGYAGFTLLELIVAISIIATLGVIGASEYAGYVQKAKDINAASAIAELSLKIASYRSSYGVYPNSLNALKRTNILDPWGRPYQYLKIENGGLGVGQARKDRFLVPVNSDFDLYSMGRDGMSAPALTAAKSRDDIIRANDGAYIGKAEAF
jgi:general secretion pathway protein G